MAHKWTIHAKLYDGCDPIFGCGSKVLTIETESSSVDEVIEKFYHMQPSSNYVLRYEKVSVSDGEMIDITNDLVALVKIDKDLNAQENQENN